MRNLETLTALPAAAFRATRYADWRDSILCSIGARHCAYSQTPAERRRALAAFALPTVPHWTICDTGELGAAAYRSAASAPPAYSPFAAMVLDALRHCRRWRYYDAADAAPALPAQPLDGCHCRVCLSRQ